MTSPAIPAKIPATTKCVVSTMTNSTATVAASTIGQPDSDGIRNTSSR